MLPKTDEGQKRIQKYLLENATPEVKPIPKEEKKDEKKETPKNTDTDTYDYSDDEEVDSKEW